jgi:hypothetical protein
MTAMPADDGYAGEFRLVADVVFPEEAIALDSYAPVRLVAGIEFGGMLLDAGVMGIGDAFR